MKAYPESPTEVWDKTYPGAGELVRKHDFKLPNQIRVSDLIKERNELGYVSRYNFGTFLKEYEEVITKKMIRAAVLCQDPKYNEFE